MANRKILGLIRLFRFELPFSAGTCVVLGQVLAAGMAKALSGVTENVIVGQPIQLGTGDVKLIAKPLKLGEL